MPGDFETGRLTSNVGPALEALVEAVRAALPEVCDHCRAGDPLNTEYKHVDAEGVPFFACPARRLHEALTGVTTARLDEYFKQRFVIGPSFRVFDRERPEDGWM